MPLRPGTGQPERGEADPHRLWSRRRIDGPRAGLIRRVQYDVGLGQQPREGHVVDAVHRYDTRAMRPGLVPIRSGAERVAGRWFGSDNIGAEIRQHASGHRSGGSREVEYDDAVEE